MDDRTAVVVSAVRTPIGDFGDAIESYRRPPQGTWG